MEFRFFVMSIAYFTFAVGLMHCFRDYYYHNMSLGNRFPSPQMAIETFLSCCQLDKIGHVSSINFEFLYNFHKSAIYVNLLNMRRLFSREIWNSPFENVGN